MLRPNPTAVKYEKSCPATKVTSGAVHGDTAGNTTASSKSGSTENAKPVIFPLRARISWAEDWVAA